MKIFNEIRALLAVVVIGIPLLLINDCGLAKTFYFYGFMSVIMYVVTAVATIAGFLPLWWWRELGRRMITTVIYPVTFILFLFSSPVAIAYMAKTGYMNGEKMECICDGDCRFSIIETILK